LFHQRGVGHPLTPKSGDGGHGGDKIGHEMGLLEYHGRNKKEETIIIFEEEIFEPKM